jgi:hypothetical protein
LIPGEAARPTRIFPSDSSVTVFDSPAIRAGKAGSTSPGAPAAFAGAAEMDEKILSRSVAIVTPEISLRNESRARAKTSPRRDFIVLGLASCLKNLGIINTIYKVEICLILKQSAR